MAGMAALVDMSSLRRIKCEPKECMYKRLVNKLIVTHLWYRVRMRTTLDRGGSFFCMRSGSSLKRGAILRGLRNVLQLIRRAIELLAPCVVLREKCMSA